jgi:hypothetical protein
MARELVSPQTTQSVPPKECNDFVLDIEEDKKQRKPTGLFHLLKSNSTEFCRSTSLHGLQYIGEKNRNMTERWGRWWTELITNSYMAFLKSLKSAGKEDPCFYGTRKFITTFQKARLTESLEFITGIYSTPSHPILPSSILILSSHIYLCLPADSFS